MALVLLPETKLALAIDYNDDDAYLTTLIGAASEIILKYMKVEETDLSPVPEVVKAATITLVGYLYRNRDKDPDEDFMDGSLPAPVRSLLSLFRDPTVA